MYKATHFIITPHAGSAAYGFAFSKSPKQAIKLAKAKAWEGLCRWDTENGVCSSVGGDVTSLVAANGRMVYQHVDV